MAYRTFTGIATVPASVAIYSTDTVSASIYLPTPIAVICTPLGTHPAGSLAGPVNFVASFPIPEQTISNVNASLTFYEDNARLAPVSAVFTVSGGTPAPTSSTPSAGLNTLLSQTSLTFSSTSSGSSPSSLSNATSPGSPSIGPASTSQATGNNLSIIRKGFSSGDLAAAAAGCGVGGALIVGLVIFLLYWRRNKRKPGILPGSGSGARSEKGCSDLNSSNEGVVVVDTKSWEKHLPQSESDQAVRSMASRTLDQIEMHVENFYQDTTNVPLSRAAEAEIQNFGSSHLPDSVLSLIRKARRPTWLIKHCIANLIMPRIEFENDSSGSFLPRSMTALDLSSSAPEKPGFAQALAHWRVVSTYLSQEPERDRAYLEERDRRITAAATKLCIAFEPWARSTDNARFQSIISIMQRASDLGIMLFSQRASFRWQWEADNRGGRAHNDPGRVVVLPGLYKVTDENAHRLAAPIHLIEPKLCREGWF